MVFLASSSLYRFKSIPQIPPKKLKKIKKIKLF